MYYSKIQIITFKKILYRLIGSVISTNIETLNHAFTHYIMRSFYLILWGTKIPFSLLEILLWPHISCVPRNAPRL
jgi:hypothetical protein